MTRAPVSAAPVTGAPVAGATMTSVEVGTSQGPARVGLMLPTGSGGPAFLLALTHGAGGTVDAPDLAAARDAAVRLGGAVAMITQPYRLRGARAPGSATRQDEAWREIIAFLRGGLWSSPPGVPPGVGVPLTVGVPLIVGGRSNGARVACRTAAAVGASGVIALAFPLRPPGHRAAAGRTGTRSVGTGSTRRGSAGTGRTGTGSARTSHPSTRDAELRAAADGGTSVLVVNGDRDPFGIPDPGDAIRVVVLKGESHSLSRNPAAVAVAVADWLSDVVPLVR